MSDEAALMASVLARPGDAASALVYADWLDERGDVRGPILRTVAELTRTPICSAAYRYLRTRRDRLSRGCDEVWLKSMLRAAVPDLRTKVEELGQLDRDRSVFASGSHQYRLNPPLAEKVVRRIEDRIGCRLPDQYRQFVTQVADGGAGR